LTVDKYFAFRQNRKVWVYKSKEEAYQSQSFLLSKHVGDVGTVFRKHVLFDSGFALLGHAVICQHEDNRRFTLLAGHCILVRGALDPAVRQFRNGTFVIFIVSVVTQQVWI
jgi:hypothetical protein